ncbi:hypothetical protein pb186bvf_004952 [Paramecium bursaria]
MDPKQLKMLKYATKIERVSNVLEEDLAQRQAKQYDKIEIAQKQCQSNDEDSYVNCLLDLNQRIKDLETRQGLYLQYWQLKTTECLNEQSLRNENFEQCKINSQALLHSVFEKFNI